MPRILPDRTGYTGYVCDGIDPVVIDPVCPTCSETCPSPSSGSWPSAAKSTKVLAIADACAICQADATRCAGDGQTGCTGATGDGCYVIADEDCVCDGGDWICTARACCGATDLCLGNDFAYMPQKLEGLVTDVPWQDLGPVYSNPLVDDLRKLCGINYDLFDPDDPDSLFVDLFTYFQTAGLDANLLLDCYCGTDVKYPVGYLKPILRLIDWIGGGGGGGPDIGRDCATKYGESCNIEGTTGLTAGTELLAVYEAAMECPGATCPEVTQVECGCTVLECHQDGCTGATGGWVCSWQVCCAEDKPDYPSCAELGCANALATPTWETVDWKEDYADAYQEVLDACVGVTGSCAAHDASWIYCLCRVSECHQSAGGLWKCTSQMCCDDAPPPTCTGSFGGEDPLCDNEHLSIWEGIDTGITGAMEAAELACNDGFGGSGPCDCYDLGWEDCDVVDPPACHTALVWCVQAGDPLVWTCDAHCCCRDYSEEFPVDCDAAFGETGCGDAGTNTYLGVADVDLDEAKDNAEFKCLTEGFGWCVGEGYLDCDLGPACYVSECHPTHAGFADNTWECTATLCCAEPPPPPGVCGIRFNCICNPDGGTWECDPAGDEFCVGDTDLCGTPSAAGIACNAESNASWTIISAVACADLSCNADCQTWWDAQVCPDLSALCQCTNTS